MLQFPRMLFTWTKQEDFLSLHLQFLTFATAEGQRCCSTSHAVWLGRVWHCKGDKQRGVGFGVHPLGGVLGFAKATLRLGANLVGVWLPAWLSWGGIETLLNSIWLP